jgi:hypothetical protein
MFEDALKRFITCFRARVKTLDVADIEEGQDDQSLDSGSLAQNEMGLANMSHYVAK